MKRDEFITRQRVYLDEVFALTDGERETRERFERMAAETFEHLTAAGKFVYAFSIEPDSAFNPIKDHRTRVLLPPGLVEQWSNGKRHIRICCTEIRGLSCTT
jgi:hypothetical protein